MSLEGQEDVQSSSREDRVSVSGMRQAAGIFGSLVAEGDLLPPHAVWSLVSASALPPASCPDGGLGLLDAASRLGTFRAHSTSAATCTLLKRKDPPAQSECS